MVGLPIKEQIKKQNELILKKPLPVYHPLTDQDRKNFVLTIDQHKIKNIRDTLVYGKKLGFIKCPLKLTNKSNDTLKYINMTCSWEEVYQIDKNNVMGIWAKACDSNFPTIITIPPQKALVINVPVIIHGSLGKNRAFKIGMSLQEFISREQLFDFDAQAYLLRPETKNLIWSNEVKVP
jgi:hypothetical protein